jgi:LacI family transcriptional regulator
MSHNEFKTHDDQDALLQARTQAVELVRRTVSVEVGLAPRRFNLKEIAKLAGVSKSTVSRVLRNEPRVSPVTRERIKTIIQELKYQPNVFARGLKGVKTGLIGVISRWIESGFYAELLRGIDDEVKPRGGRLLCSFTPYLDEYVEQWRLFAQGGQVDGVVLIAPEVDLFRHSVQPGDVPCAVVCADPTWGGASWRYVDSVNLANAEGMRALVNHLYQIGCRRLIHFAGENTNMDGRERADAFLEAVNQYLDCEGTVEGQAWTAQMGRDVMRDFIECKRPMPDAFVAFNDSAALGMLKMLREAGKEVPRDVVVTGWDNEPASELADLTTVDLPVRDIARSAVGLLFERMSEDKRLAPARHERVPVHLVPRASSRRPSS